MPIVPMPPTPPALRSVVLVFSDRTAIQVNGQDAATLYQAFVSSGSNIAQQVYRVHVDAVDSEGGSSPMRAAQGRDILVNLRAVEAVIPSP